MKKGIKEILEIESELISPSPEEITEIKAKTSEVIAELNKNIKQKKIKAEVFVGGSLAKDTLIKKDKYDIDLFVRFEKAGDMEKIGKIVPSKAMRIHGSRDYFSLKDKSGKLTFEIIPVLRIKKPENAENITDLSYFHVSYIKKQINKSKKLANEIRLAKAFAYFQECYGAESYINGFSGYAVELLVSYYKTFENFIKAVAGSDVKREKIILDPEKKYKNRGEIEKQMNEAKLQSPIIFIDPTFKERNALAALSDETFFLFKDACFRFLRNPSFSFFKLKDKEEAIRKKYGKALFSLTITTDKQSGDIAGTKLKKFSGFFIRELSRYFDVKDYVFSYDEKENLGKLTIAAKQKDKLKFSGPLIKPEMEKALEGFKREHKKIIVKNNKAYAYEKSINFKEFMNKFLNEKSKVISDMDVNEIKY